MNRRAVLAGAGVWAAGLVAGCSELISSSDHLIIILNERESNHEVSVELDLDGEESTYGPKTVESGDDWRVKRFETQGTLTVRCHVDGELVWDDMHDIPPDGDRRSSALVVLEPGDEVQGWVEQDD
ncbi:hypothetical protein [Halomontanus rarus]|uniref:hypothetical protein n=1 Tax=Halomontanus rarus TaxID=3034020 RepID=UPI0023E759D3|nr:hypothetical protein [Halovivax sp. TS33]